MNSSSRAMSSRSVITLLAACRSRRPKSSPNTSSGQACAALRVRGGKVMVVLLVFGCGALSPAWGGRARDVSTSLLLGVDGKEAYSAVRAAARAVSEWSGDLSAGRTDQFLRLRPGRGVVSACGWPGLGRGVASTHTSPLTHLLPRPQTGGGSPHFVPGRGCNDGADEGGVGTGQPPGMRRPAAMGFLELLLVLVVQGRTGGQADGGQFLQPHTGDSAVATDPAGSLTHGHLVD